MDTLELIQALPQELRKQILKEYIQIKLWQRKMLGWDDVRKEINKAYTSMKLRQRKALGWDEVHAEIKEAPFCGYNQQIVKVIKCISHYNEHCFRNNHCNLCKRDGFYHYLGYPIYDENDYDKCFNVYWGDCWRGGDKIRQIGLEEVFHEEIKPPPLWKDSYGFKRVKIILNEQPLYFLR